MKLSEITAKRIGGLRKQENTSQKEFAKKVEIHHNTINNIINGKTKANLKTIAKICRKLVISLDEFFNDPKLKANDFEID